MLGAGTLAVRQQSNNSSQTKDLAVSNNGAATLASSLPQQVVVGGYYDVMGDLRLLGQVDWTEYSKNQQLAYTGGFTSGATLIDLATRPTYLGWSNQSVYRLGGEYSGWSFAKIRAGYAYTTQVTNSSFASPTLAAPGTANTFTLGLGGSKRPCFTISWRSCGRGAVGWRRDGKGGELRHKGRGKDVLGDRAGAAGSKR
jgi:long-subunit fatty acid transport protein